jgi:transposase
MAMIGVKIVLFNPRELAFCRENAFGAGRMGSRKNIQFVLGDGIRLSLINNIPSFRCAPFRLLLTTQTKAGMKRSGMTDTNDKNSTLFLGESLNNRSPSMSNLPVYVGLDYHTKVIQVCVMDQKGNIFANQSVANNCEAVQQVVAPYGNNISVAIDASTGSANFADELATKYNWHVEQAHPGYVSRMKQTPDKSDWTDAKLLADLTRVGYIPRVWLAPQYIRELRDLVKHRDGYVKQRTQVKLRLRALLRQHRINCPHSPWTIDGKDWLRDESNITSTTLLFQLKDYYDTIEYLDKKIDTVTSLMKSHVADDAVVKQLLEQPGIGIITAITMRAIIGQFDRFRTGKQLAHFCAVCPRNNSSAGKTTTGGLIKAGDDVLRQILIEAAHRLMRYDPEWKAMADRLLAKGKKKCVVVAAVANRWIRKLFHRMTESASIGDAEVAGNSDVRFLRHEQKSRLSDSSSDARPLEVLTPEVCFLGSVIP